MFIDITGLAMGTSFDILSGKIVFIGPIKALIAFKNYSLVLLNIVRCHTALSFF